MTDLPKYLPYTSPLKPFSIGLSAIEADKWLEPDADLAAYVDEKMALCQSNFDEIFYSEPVSVAAQQECLELIVSHLTSQHGDFYRRDGNILHFAGRKVDLADAAALPLLKAGSLIADDLVIMQKRESGWHLAAGYVAFPSAWSLRQKAGLPMEGVHAHVPGFEGGTRNAMMLNRIFDNLQPDLPAMRLNWSIYPSAELFWPPERGARSEKTVFTPAENFIRVERQTLRRLPKTGAIVFTIRIYPDPLAALKRLDGGGELARALADKLMEFSPEQLAYKGMVSKRDMLVRYLRDEETVTIRA